jgi:tRNA pseudouridine55 synthase
MKEMLFVIDKRPGPSSFDVVRSVKRLLTDTKVGHTGSLDPFASGVLVLLTGKATKLSNCLLNADKSYEALVKLGESTDTQDRTGTVDAMMPVPELTFENIKEVLKSFEGTWMQTPPMYSAKKVNGVRLYELARNNISIRREPIAVQLYRVEAKSYDAPFIRFEVHCSKGTYIRSLADEIGKRLGTLGVLQELRRQSCGTFTLSEAVTVETLSEQVTVGMERGYDNYLRLLKQEGLFGRTTNRPPNFLVNNPRDSHLQMASKSGKSFVN